MRVSDAEPPPGKESEDMETEVERLEEWVGRAPGTGDDERSGIGDVLRCLCEELLGTGIRDMRAQEETV